MLKDVERYEHLLGVMLKDVERRSQICGFVMVSFDPHRGGSVIVAVVGGGGGEAEACEHRGTCATAEFQVERNHV